MKLGILSDTHGDTQATLAVARMFDELGVDALLHLGDIGSPEVLSVLDSRQGYYVVGNCDPVYYLGSRSRETCEQKRVIAANYASYPEFEENPNVNLLGTFGKINLEGVRIGLHHGHYTERLWRMCDSGEFDLVCYGHTHTFAEEQRKKTMVLNPGALVRTPRPGFVVMDLPSLQYDRYYI